MKIVFSRIKDLRLKEKQSQNDIAKVLNVCQSTYSKWESGNEMIPLEKLFTLSIFYKKSMNYITGLSSKNEIYDINELNPKIIGKNIKMLRCEKNISQLSLSKLLKTNQSTVSAFENGKVLILTIFIYKISKKFKYPIDKLCQINNNKKTID